MAQDFKKIHIGVNIVPKTTSTVAAKGDMDVTIADGKINSHNGTTSSPIVTEAHTATLTNKSIDADTNTITNIENADIKAAAAIDASKIADGTVSNAEFQFINSVTSNVQTQLNSKASSVLLDSHIFVGNASNVATDVAVTGDVVISNAGVTAISAGVIVNADINASAAIDASKIADGSVSSTEFQQLDGISSNIQTQLDSKVSTTDTATLTNKSLVDSTTFIIDDADNTKKMQFQVSGVTTATTRTLTVPNASTTIVGTDVAQTLTNKTLDNTNTITVKDTLLTIQDDGDATKQAKFQASGITTATTRTLTIPDANTTIVGTDAAQVITAKDIDGGTASNTSRITVPKAAKATLDGLTRKEATLVFASDTDKLYIDDGSVLKPVGSGSGGINFMNLSSTWSADNTDNVDAETSVGSWVAYADAAAATPVDMTGGSPTVAISRTTTAGQVLDGVASFKVVKDAANRQGEGVSCTLNVPPAYQGKLCQIRVPYKVSTGTLATGDLACFIYDVTNSLLITPLANAVDQSSGTVNAYFTTTPSAGTPANQQYRVGFHFASTSAVAQTFEFDDVTVGMIDSVYGPNIAAWQTYTPTLSGFGTTTNVSGKFRQVGDSIEVDITFNPGTVAASLASTTLPNNYTLDSSKLPISNTTAAAGAVVGDYTQNVATNFGKLVTAAGTSTTLVYFGALGASTNQLIPQNGSSIANNTTAMAIRFSVPITELSASTPAVILNPNIGPWQTYTPTFTGFGTVSTQSFYWRQVGENVELYGRFTGGTATAVEARVSFPSGYTSSSNYTTIEHAGNAITGNTGDDISILIEPSVTYVTFGSNAAAAVGTTKLTGSNIGSGQVMSFQATIKMVGLSAAGVINNPRSSVRFSTPSGNGSTNTTVRNFTVTEETVGSDLTGTTSGTDGTSVLVNVDGIYSLDWFGESNSAGTCLIIPTKNSANLATSPATSAYLSQAQGAATGYAANLSRTAIFKRGDVIRPQTLTSAKPNSTGADTQFVITKVSN